MKKWYVFLMLTVWFLSGCSTRTGSPPAALQPVTELSETEKLMEGHVLQQGAGNLKRIVAASNGDHYLELAAGGQGNAVYSQEIDDSTAQVDFKLQFLSTQGTGRIRIQGLTADNQVVQTVGWAITGELPVSTAAEKWIDSRSGVNYRGDWMEAKYNIAQIFQQQFAGLANRAIVKYRFDVEAGEGQHVYIARLSVPANPAVAVAIQPEIGHVTAKLGDIFTVAATVENTGSQTLSNVNINLVEPYGYGLVVQSPATQQIATLTPGEKQQVRWQVKAQRPHSVNFSNPWPLTFTVNSVPLPARVTAEVADTRPGSVYYVMTEDLEPIDSAGYLKRWGNGSGWLEPQELLVQMVHKAEALNAVAEKNGAKWTHYIAWPAIEAAQWAAGQSGSGEWPKVIAAIKSSVMEQSSRGHEYGVHMHTDYDPLIEGNVLSYNPAVDGFWANHMRHGWAHSLPVEGDFSNRASRTGSLYYYQRVLDELSAASGQGQLLTSRAGSFDFGDGSADEAMSVRVYKKVGLWGSSDADGNAGGITAGPYGNELYFSAADDINAPAKDIRTAGIVEFRPTPQQFIAYDTQSAVVMNSKADEGMAYFRKGGGIIPGVHAIVGFTHAMFIMGNGDWQSTQGGQFKEIEDHLAYLRQQYVDKGWLTFATASELVARFLDYNTPALLAVYGAPVKTGWWSSEFAVTLLGRDIPVDSSHVHTVSIKYPLYLRDGAYRIVIEKNGTPVYSTWGLPTPYNDIEFAVDDAQAQYTMRVYHNRYFAKFITGFRVIKQKIQKTL